MKMERKFGLQYKAKYISPISEVIVQELENQILQGSMAIEDDVEVSTCGQEVIEIDFTDRSWE